MHGVIRDKLEDLLAAGWSLLRFENHLEGCGDCSSELRVMKAQSRQLETLRAPENLEPTAGFYARVLQRIDEQEIGSIWELFVDSRFGQRLTFVSLGIAVLLGSYVVSTVSRDRSFSSTAENIMALNSRPHYDAPVMGSQAEQRDAVLENFATHHLVETEGQVR